MIPETIPVVELTVATALLLLQVPPGVIHISVVVVPTHNEDVPLIAEGEGATVRIVMDLQPVLVTVYEILVVPAAMPVATPVLISIEAFVGMLTLHVPPGVLQFSDTDDPTQTVADPVMAPGSGLTVTTRVE